MAGVVEWASNAVYGAGHGAFTGLANKDDPGATIQGDGIVPGEAVGSQHLNYVLNEITKSVLGASKRELELLPILDHSSGSFLADGRLEVLHETQLPSGGDRFAVISGNKSFPVFSTGQLINAGQTFHTTSNEVTGAATDGLQIFASQGANGLGTQVKADFTTAGFIAPATDMAAVGTPGFSYYSVDQDLIYVSLGNLILFSLEGANLATAVQLTLTGGGTNLGEIGIAEVGTTLLLTNKSGDINQVYDYDGSTTVSLVGALPTVTGGSDTSDLVSTSQFFFWGQVEDDGGTDVYRIYRSTSGVSWTLMVTFAGDGTGLTNGVGLLADKYSDAIYMILPTGTTTSGAVVSVSKDSGITWSETVRCNQTDPGEYAAAGGYLWMGFDNNLFRTSLRLAEAV